MTQLLTSTHLRRLPLSDDDRLVLAARFEEYLTWRHAGAPAPRSAAEMAERIGWQAHTVIRHCENIKNRYIRSRPGTARAARPGGTGAPADVCRHAGGL